MVSAPFFENRFVIISAKKCAAIRFPLRVLRILALCAQNDIPFRHCEGAGVRWTPLRSRSTDRAGRRDANGCGNPFSLMQFQKNLAIIQAICYNA